jgi:predicted acylesterase/phospholipase RssA
VFFAKLKKQGKISSIMSDGEIEKIEDTVELGPISVKFFEIWEKGFGFILSKFPSPVALSNSSVNIVLNTMKLLLPKKLGGFIPRDNITGAISNLIWDRGVYSGFEIREFFFRIILLSLSKDTHFRRKFIANKDMLQEFKIEAIDLENIEGCMVGFKLIKNEKNYKTLTKLSKTFAEDLTFEKFYKITRINLSCCVSNATYGQPMYFSSYFTPDFPVIEAMGASMSFPLAFKPLYCEANVIIDKENFGKEMNTEENTFVTYGKSKSGNIIKELFSQSDFIKYQNIVLSYIKKNCKLEFSLNSNLSFRSYLPYLRAIIHNEDFQEPFSYINSYTQQSESYSIKQIKELCYFFYNSAFKGLHVDGGATNNLPIAVHTYMTPENGILKYTNLQVLDIKEKVLSLKLDNTFPPDIKETVLKELMLDKNKKTLERLSNWQDKFATFTLVKQIKKGLKLKNALKRIKKDPIALEKILDMSEEVWVKICEEIIEDYKLTRKGFTPWNKQIIFLNAVMTPLQFGMDQGQIEAIEDNENIIPLYSFGLSVFDFDLTSKKLKPLVDVANEQSEKAVLNNFNS